jgi:hypothetical protein
MPLSMYSQHKNRSVSILRPECARSKGISGSLGRGAPNAGGRDLDMTARVSDEFVVYGLSAAMWALHPSSVVVKTRFESHLAIR